MLSCQGHLLPLWKLISCQFKTASSGGLHPLVNFLDLWHPEVALGSGCGVVRWPSWIVARSLVVARCEFCARSGLVLWCSGHFGGDLVAQWFNARLRTVHRQLAADRFPPGTGPRSWRGRRVSLKYRRPAERQRARATKKMQWPFWIVTWSFAAALCQFLRAKCAPRGCGVFATNRRQFLFFGALLEEHVEAVRRRHIWCTVEARSIITCNPPFNERVDMCLGWFCFLGGVSFHAWEFTCFRQDMGKSSFHSKRKIWSQDPWTGQESSSMAKLGDEDLAQNVKAWLNLG